MTFPTKPWRRRWVDNFVTGLLILAPTFVTFLVMRFLIRQITALCDPVVRLLKPWLTSTWAALLVQIGAVLIFAVFVAVIGWAAQLLLVRRIFGIGERWGIRLPMVGKIYAATRDLAQAFGGEHKAAFTRVVLIEWLGPGRYVIGFVTQEGPEGTQAHDHLINVFVPHAPNPMSGFLMLTARDSLIPLEMSVEDGMKLVISAGVVGPVVRTPPPLEAR